MRWRKPKAGSRWNGPSAYCHDYQLVEKPGYYALEDDGKTFLKIMGDLVRLTYVDDAPGVEDDGTGHYEVASKTDPVARQGPVTVDLEARAKGVSATEVQ